MACILTEHILPRAARRLIAAGAVRINREPVTDPELLLPGQEPLVISRGKNHFVRVCFTD